MEIIPVPDSDDTLELALTADGYGYIASIASIRSDGSAAWTALPPGGQAQDAWTVVRLEGQRLPASCWSSFDAHPQPRHGQRGQQARHKVKDRHRTTSRPLRALAGSPVPYPALYRP